MAMVRVEGDSLVASARDGWVQLADVEQTAESFRAAGADVTVVTSPPRGARGERALSRARAGGFGGGYSGGDGCCGGGGGYSEGEGGWVAGGGGSFDGATAPMNAAGANDGPGSVRLERI